MPSAVRKLLPSLTGIAGLACALCCAIPILITAGVLGGTAWASLGQLMPGIAVVLAVLAGGAWWWASRRRGHQTGCAGGDCSCTAAA
jgi:hypothetical protein